MHQCFPDDCLYRCPHLCSTAHCCCNCCFLSQGNSSHDTVQNACSVPTQNISALYVFNKLWSSVSSRGQPSNSDPDCAALTASTSFSEVSSFISWPILTLYRCISLHLPQFLIQGHSAESAWLASFLPYVTHPSKNVPNIALSFILISFHSHFAVSFFSFWICLSASKSLWVAGCSVISGPTEPLLFQCKHSEEWQAADSLPPPDVSTG